jgi:hypothetical protein
MHRQELTGDSSSSSSSSSSSNSSGVKDHATISRSAPESSSSLSIPGSTSRRGGFGRFDLSLSPVSAWHPQPHSNALSLPRSSSTSPLQIQSLALSSSHCPSADSFPRASSPSKKKKKKKEAVTPVRGLQWTMDAHFRQSGEVANLAVLVEALSLESIGQRVIYQGYLSSGKYIDVCVVS